jgi:hypothetical protein
MAELIDMLGLSKSWVVRLVKEPDSRSRLPGCGRDRSGLMRTLQRGRSAPAAPSTPSLIIEPPGTSASPALPDTCSLSTSSLG